MISSIKYKACHARLSNIYFIKIPAKGKKGQRTYRMAKCIKSFLFLDPKLAITEKQRTP